MCTEILIRNLLGWSEDVAVVYIELTGWAMKYSNAGAMQLSVANFYNIPFLSFKSAVWPFIRSKTAIYKGLETEEIHKIYWPMDDTHFNEVGHNTIVDIIRHMIYFESTAERAAIEVEPGLPPDEWEPAEEIERWGARFPQFPDHYRGKNTITSPALVIEKQSTYVYFATCVSNMALPDKDYLLPAEMRGKGLTVGQGGEGFKPLKKDEGWEYVEENGGKWGWIANDGAGGKSITFPVTIPDKELGG